MSAKLFVGNLSPDTTSAQLRALFSEIGVVDSCILITDPDTDLSKGYGYVDMNSLLAAAAAREKFNGQVLHGHSLQVAEAGLPDERRNREDDSEGSRSYDFSSERL